VADGTVGDHLPDLHLVDLPVMNLAVPYVILLAEWDLPAVLEMGLAGLPVACSVVTQSSWVLVPVGTMVGCLVIGSTVPAEVPEDEEEAAFVPLTRRLWLGFDFVARSCRPLLEVTSYAAVQSVTSNVPGRRGFGRFICTGFETGPGATGATARASIGWPGVSPV
jgi:hypothetical protein